MSPTAKSISTTCPCMLTSNTDRISLPESHVAQSTFHSTTILTSSDKNRIRSSLTQTGRDLIELDATLAHIESVRQRLLSKREAFQTFCDTHNGLVSALRLIPSEILTEIFSYFKPSTSKDTDVPLAWTEMLLITHICHRWRQIALSTPSLWTDISVDVKWGYDVRLWQELERVNVWLTRARGLSLSIDIRCPYFAFKETWNAVLEVLLPTSHRWRHAVIISLPQIDLSRILRNMPLLETLELRLDPRKPIESDTFKIRSMLRNTVLQISGAPSTSRLLWPQLRVFKTDCCFSSRQSLDLLQMMPNVVSFGTNLRDDMFEWDESYDAELDNDAELDKDLSDNGLSDNDASDNDASDSDDSTFNPSYPLRLSKLENLELSHGNGITGLFDSLELPSLTRFKFWECNDEIPTDWDTSLLSLIQRSSCKIKSLIIIPENLRGQTSVDDLLRVTPNLEHLSFNPVDKSYAGAGWGFRNVVHSLKPSSVNPLAPELQTLTLTYKDQFQMQPFVDMVDSRWRVGGEAHEGPVSRIKSIKVREIRVGPDARLEDAMSMIFASAEAIGCLNSFGSEGLDMKMHFRHFQGGEWYDADHVFE